jgi:hypothetical protein
VFVHPDLGPPVPTAFRVEPPPDQVSARLGETVRIEGAHLEGTGVQVRFSHPLLDDPIVVDVGVNQDASAVAVELPSDAAADAAWPAGVWTARVALAPPGDPVVRETNPAAFVLAPEPVLAPAPAIVRDAGTGAVTVTMQARPRVRPTQRAVLALDGDAATAEPRTAATDPLVFTFGRVPGGERRVRLTVDGAESRLVDRSTSPPAFDPTQVVEVPA